MSSDLTPAAVISQVFPKVVGTPGKLTYAKKSTVDFVGQARLGVITRPIAFDCKGVTGKASLVVKPEEIHQWAYLRDVVAGGGLGFYLLEDAREQRIWILDAGLLAGTGAVSSVPFRRLAKGKTVESFVPTCTYGLLPGGIGLGYDFLALLRA